MLTNTVFIKPDLSQASGDLVAMSPSGKKGIISDKSGLYLVEQKKKSDVPRAIKKITSDEVPEDFHLVESR